MRDMKKRADHLTAEDFLKHPVWRFTGSDTPDETYLRPVRQLPAKQLGGCIIGSRMLLANRTAVTGCLGNLNPANSRATEHFLTLCVFRSDGARFHLARYHDVDAARRSPTALAAFLGLPLELVFPIAYDVSKLVAGPLESLRGTINVEPRERLTRPELIKLAVPRPTDLD
jgi:hypothetical protein